jgi:pimeloyl-ACP methyl ester carboxylesterase
MPDYYGFGVSADRPQAFLDPETTARGNIDGYFAALQLLQDRKVEIPERVYSFGYSQGGFNAMANLKYVSAHPELGIHFQKVICGGSPFNVERTWMEYTKEDSAFRSAVAFVPLTMVSINESHKLSIDYSQLFKGNLLDNWQDWILSKKNSLSQLNRLLGTTDLSEILNDDFMAGKGEAYEKIMEVCRSYSLTTGWTPPSDTYIILFHSTSDDIVPYANYQEMTAFLESAGVQKGTGPGYYYSIDGNYEGHVDAAVYYIVYTIFEW